MAWELYVQLQLINYNYISLITTTIININYLSTYNILHAIYLISKLWRFGAGENEMETEHCLSKSY